MDLEMGYFDVDTIEDLKNQRDLNQEKNES